MIRILRAADLIGFTLVAKGVFLGDELSKWVGVSLFTASILAENWHNYRREVIAKEDLPTR
jgi:hypothetical protein